MLSVISASTSFSMGGTTSGSGRGQHPSRASQSVCRVAGWSTHGGGTYLGPSQQLSFTEKLSCCHGEGPPFFRAPRVLSEHQLGSFNQTRTSFRVIPSRPACNHATTIPDVLFNNEPHIHQGTARRVLCMSG